MLRQFFPGDYQPDVFSISYDELWSKGYRGILFDIDNTLVHHGECSTPRVDAFIAALQKKGWRLLLLTDNDQERVERFVRHMDIDYICDAGKPAPDNYLRAVKRMGLKKNQVIVIGDQIFTDILGANRSGLSSILVQFIRLPEEKWIGKRRYAEKVLLLLYRLEKKLHII